METLALKLVATPTLILLATLAGRRFGNAIGGWVVALPLTSGPIALFLFGFAAFFAVVGALVTRAGIAAAFTLGALAAFATHGLGYAAIRRAPPPGPID